MISLFSSHRIIDSCILTGCHQEPPVKILYWALRKARNSPGVIPRLLGSCTALFFHLNTFPASSESLCSSSRPPSACMSLVSGQQQPSFLGTMSSPSSALLPAELNKSQNCVCDRHWQVTLWLNQTADARRVNDCGCKGAHRQTDSCSGWMTIKEPIKAGAAQRCVISFHLKPMIWSLTCPLFGWRAVSFGWTASSSCVFLRYHRAVGALHISHW